jgi:hypothetical protein
LVASKTLLSQYKYQNHVITKKHVAADQLKTDLDAVATLKKSYDAFTSTSQNVLGGNPNGSGPQDGNNAQIIIHSLPSTYDFPALANSIEAMALSQKLTIKSVAGIDEEATQSSNLSSATPQATPMPFQVTVEGDYQGMQRLITLFELSTRPIQVQSVSISGDEGDLTMVVSAQTFYQPSKSLNISSTVVK